MLSGVTARLCTALREQQSATSGLLWTARAAKLDAIDLQMKVRGLLGFVRSVQSRPSAASQIGILSRRQPNVTESAPAASRNVLNVPSAVGADLQPRSPRAVRLIRARPSNAKLGRLGAPRCRLTLRRLSSNSTDRNPRQPRQSPRARLTIPGPAWLSRRPALQRRTKSLDYVSTAGSVIVIPSRFVG